MCSERVQKRIQSKSSPSINQRRFRLNGTGVCGVRTTSLGATVTRYRVTVAANQGGDQTPTGNSRNSSGWAIVHVQSVSLNAALSEEFPGGALGGHPPQEQAISGCAWVPSGRRFRRNRDGDNAVGGRPNQILDHLSVGSTR